jgi:hypothetical protein
MRASFPHSRKASCSQSWSESCLDQRCVRDGPARVFYGPQLRHVQRLLHGQTPMPGDLAVRLRLTHYHSLLPPSDPQSHPYRCRQTAIGKSAKSQSKVLGCRFSYAPVMNCLAVLGKAVGISAALSELPLILIGQPGFAIPIHVEFSSHSVASGVTFSGQTKMYRKTRSAMCHQVVNSATLISPD